MGLLLSGGAAGSGLSAVKRPGSNSGWVPVRGEGGARLSAAHTQDAACPGQERSLLALGQEVRRFSELEAQLQKKDQEVLLLHREMETLRKQLKCILRSKGLEITPFPSRRVSWPRTRGAPHTM